jgi:hypothetical protein
MARYRRGENEIRAGGSLIAETARKEAGMAADNNNIEVHEGRRVGGVVSVRLKPEELEVLEALAESSGRSLSETLRVALHRYARTPDLPRLSRPGEVIGYTRGGESRDDDEVPVTA